MLEKIFIKKSIKTLLKEADQKNQTFKRTLGAFNLAAIGVGAIVGTGLFSLTASVAAEYAGPGVLFSFIIAAVISLFAALCYAEFAALMPIAGSAYSYAYVTMGEFIAWILGWSITLQYLVSACTISVSWGGYFKSLLADFGCAIPVSLSSSPFAYHPDLGWVRTGSFINLPSLCILGLMGVLISKGMKAAVSFNNIMLFLKFSVVALFVICGFKYIQVDNFFPLIPENLGDFGAYGLSGVAQGAGVLFFAFVGFDTLSTLAQETKNPQKNLPIGMMGSLAICALIYLLFSIVLIGVVNFKDLGVESPITLVINRMGSSFIWLNFFIKIALLAGFTSGIMVMLLGQVRVLYTMAHDGLLPHKMTKIKDKTHVPFFTTLVMTLIGCTIAAFSPLEVLGQLVSISTLMTFAIVCLGVLILRYKQPKLHRPFKTPWMPWVPIIGGVICLIQMLIFPWSTWLQLIIWIIVGCILYFSYGIKKSKLQIQNKHKIL